MSSPDTNTDDDNKLPEDPDLTDVVDLSEIKIESKGEDAFIRNTN